MKYTDHGQKYSHDRWSQLFFFFSKCIAIVLENNQTEQEIYVIFGIILYKYNNIIDKYLLGKNAWKVDDQRLMFVLKFECTDMI